MKKKILLSTLITPLVLTSVATVSSCSVKIQEETKAETPVENEPLTAQTVTVHFKTNDSHVTFEGSTDVTAKVGRQFGTITKPIAYKNKYVFTEWRDADNKPISDTYLIPAGGLTVYPFFQNDSIGDCVGISAIQDSTISIVNHGPSRPNIEYSNDGRDWKPYNGQILNVPAGSVYYFKGHNEGNEELEIPPGFSQSETDYTSFCIGGTASLEGNVMTLIDGGSGTTTEIPNPYCFYRLFEGCSGIVSISSNLLPATKLTKYCYAYMFEDCTRLTDFPHSLLPAENLVVGGDASVNTACYAGMFMNCTGIKTIPTSLLPAKNLSYYCYYGMFQGCTGITTLPNGILPATHVEYGCYDAMFSGCTSLTTLGDDLLASASQTNALAPLCYDNMFSRCTSLVDASNLRLPAPITSADTYCYEQMFYACTKLEKAPALPSTTLSEGCYSAMFYNCYALKTAPTLGATNLASDCYEYMFYHCHALTAIPELPATTLQPYCYAEMFSFCSGFVDLSSCSLPATTLADHCYYRMFRGCENMTSQPAFPTSGTINLATYCCAYMFDSCGLTTTVNLIATTAKSYCYYYMYTNCQSMTKAGYISLSTFTDSEYACSHMFDDCANLYIGNNDGFGTYDVAILNLQQKSTGNNFDRMLQDTGFNRGSGGPSSMDGYIWGYENDPPSP